MVSNETFFFLSLLKSENKIPPESKEGVFDLKGALERYIIKLSSSLSQITTVVKGWRLVNVTLHCLNLDWILSVCS